MDPLPTWVPVGNALNRLVAKPKHHLADPALSARLLGLDSRALLTGSGRVMNPGAGVALGALFEALATLCVRVFAQTDEAGVRANEPRADKRERRRADDPARG